MIVLALGPPGAAETNRNRNVSCARITRASIMARRLPMQARGPSPKGHKMRALAAAAEPLASTHRSGCISAGRSKKSGGRCIAGIEINENDRACLECLHEEEKGAGG